MANTYTQLYFHIVLGVDWRRNLIADEWKVDLYKYIAGIIIKKNEKPMITNGVADHIHILLSTKGNCNLSDLIRVIKCNSAKWINDQGFVKGKFKWQLGYGAFSVSQSQVKRVINYIKNQGNHHARKSFRKEYRELLDAYEVEYKEKYLFD